METPREQRVILTVRVRHPLTPRHIERLLEQSGASVEQSAAYEVASLLDAQLTEAEITVLRALAACESNREIAEQLHVSVFTVKVHFKSLFKKLRVRSRTAAVIQAIRLGLLLP